MRNMATAVMNGHIHPFLRQAVGAPISHWCRHRQPNSGLGKDNKAMQGARQSQQAGSHRVRFCSRINRINLLTENFAPSLRMNTKQLRSSSTGFKCKAPKNTAAKTTMAQHRKFLGPNVCPLRCLRPSVCRDSALRMYNDAHDFSKSRLAGSGRHV